MEWRDHLVGSRRVGDQNIQFGGFADSPVGDHSKFAAVHNRYTASRQPHHRRVELRLICIEATRPPRGIHAVRANEHRANQHVFQCLQGRGTYQREPFAVQMSAGHENIDVLALGKFHRYVDCVRHYRDVVVHRQARE